MIKCKLCGLMTEEDILVCNKCKPDYIGFVFAKKSRRFVTKEQAKHMKALLDPAICAVGVFVDEAIDTMLSYVEEGIIDAIQLHGHETPQVVDLLKQRTRVPILQAFSVTTPTEVQNALRSQADFLVFDGTEAGSGIPFDHRLLAEVTRPYFLAGGLEANQLTSIATHLTPYAFDVSSKIETNRKKDPEKMAAFVQAAHSLKKEED